MGIYVSFKESEIKTATSKIRVTCLKYRIKILRCSMATLMKLTLKHRFDFIHEASSDLDPVSICISKLILSYFLNIPQSMIFVQTQ